MFFRGVVMKTHASDSSITSSVRSTTRVIISVMREDARFIGRRYENGEMGDIQSAMDEWRNKSATPLENEREKTTEELRMIRVANDLMREELESLSVPGYRDIEPERIHILGSGTYEKHFPSSEEKGVYSAVSDMIAIDADRAGSSKARLFTVILHEMIHRASKRKFNEDGTGAITEARVGYRVRARWKQPERHALTGLNEVLVEHTVLKIVRKNADRIEREFGIGPESLRGPLYVYMDYAPVLARIVQGMASHRGITETEAFDLLEKGQFTETILVLKDIDRIFGAGSLQVLSCMGTLRDDAACAEVDALVFAYFNATDENERHSLMANTLSLFSTYRAQELQARP